jgi:hypothetical protein
MSADAECYWKACHNNIERQSAKGHELAAIGAFACKAPEHAARIAGVLTVFEDIRAIEISGDAMERGIRLVEWYLREALRLAHASRADLRLLQAGQLLDWLRGWAEDTFQLRDVLRLGPGQLRTKAEAERAIGVLIDHRWVSEMSERPRIFRLHRGS